MSKVTMRDVSIMGPSYQHFPLEYFLDSLQECGIHGVDLWGAEPFYYRPDWATPAEATAELKRIVREMEARDQRCVIYTPETLAYPYNFSDPTPQIINRTVEYFKWAIEDAQVMGCPRVFLNSGCGPRNIAKEESMKRLIDTYRRIADMAEDADILLTLEQLQPYESNLVLNKKDVREVLNGVDSPNLRICVDLVAMDVQGETLEEYFEEFGDKVEWIHYTDSHHEELGTGEYGAEKMRHWIDVLEENDFKNGIDLEVNDSIYWEDPHSPHKRSCDYLRNVLGLPEE